MVKAPELIELPSARSIHVPPLPILYWTSTTFVSFVPLLIVTLGVELPAEHVPASTEAVTYPVTQSTVLVSVLPLPAELVVVTYEPEEGLDVPALTRHDITAPCA